VLNVVAIYVALSIAPGAILISLIAFGASPLQSPISLLPNVYGAL